MLELQRLFWHYIQQTIYQPDKAEQIFEEFFAAVEALPIVPVKRVYKKRPIITYKEVQLSSGEVWQMDKRLDYDETEYHVPQSEKDREFYFEERRKIISNHWFLRLPYLAVLCEGLAEEPVRVRTGRKGLVKRIQPYITYIAHESEKITIPRKTIMHPQRTEADMVGEMRRELINLPRFTAYCKIVKEIAGTQQVVKYKLFPYKPESVEDRAGSPDWKKAYIVERMHDETLGYYKKRETVQQEIALDLPQLNLPIPRKPPSLPEPDE